MTNYQSAREQASRRGRYPESLLDASAPSVSSVIYDPSHSHALSVLRILAEQRIITGQEYQFNEQCILKASVFVIPHYIF